MSGRWSAAQLKVFGTADHAQVFWGGDNGPMLTHEEAQELIVRMQAFYSTHDERWVEIWNTEYLSGQAFSRLSEWLKARPSRRPRPGFVYFLRTADGFCKIGRTTQPDSRIKLLKIQLPFPVELDHMARVDDVEAGELFYHWTFARKRLNGEWFSLTDAEIEWVRTSTEFNDLLELMLLAD